MEKGKDENYTARIFTAVDAGRLRKMSLLAFILIVISAGLHASWNLVAKKTRMTIPFYALICTSATLFWVHVQFWTPVGLAGLPWKFWLFLILRIYP